MSKKRDDIDLGDDFGLDNFDDGGDGGWEGPDAASGGKRKPVTSLKGSFVDGVKEGVKDPSIQMKFVRNALPAGYNQTIDFADKVHAGVSDIYRDAVKDAEPVIKDLKKLTRKQLLPAFGDKLPKAWAEKLEGWAAEQQSSGREEIDPEENEISMSLGTMFTAQQEIIQKAEDNRVQRETAREERSIATDKVMQTQTDISNKTLAQIQMNTGRLANYQDQVTINFQRKSLELQYRTYFVNRKLLDTMEQHLDLTKSSMEILVHNSGLPDLLKSHNHEKMVEVMKMKYLGEVTDPMSKWFAGIGSKLITKGKRDIKEFFQSFGATLSDAVTGIDTLEEQNQMRRDMGEEEQSMGQMGAQMAGSMAADKGAEWGGKLFQKWSPWANSRPGQAIENSGTRLMTFFRRFPFIAQRLMTENRDDPGAFGTVLRWAGEGAGTYKRDDKVMGSATEELDKRMYWTLQNSRTLNDVIPGWLSKLHEAILEGNDIRSAGASKEALAKAETSRKGRGGASHFSFETNRFETEAEIGKRIDKELDGKDESKAIAEALNNVIDTIDPNFRLPEDVAVGIRTYLMEMARHKHVDPEVWTWLGEAEENFPKAIRGKQSGIPPVRDADDDTPMQAHGTWVGVISDVVKETFGYNKDTEWKDGKPKRLLKKFYSIFSNRNALDRLALRWGEFYRRVTSSKDKLLKLASHGFGHQEVLRKQKRLVREQEKFKDAFGMTQSRDKIDAFDWNENTEQHDKDIISSHHMDPESRAEREYNKLLAKYERDKEKYDELAAAGPLPAGSPAAPVEPVKPPHMRAKGGIIPDDKHFAIGGKKKRSDVRQRKGHVVGAGTGTSDEIATMLSSGEYVVRAGAVKRPGVLSLLRYINSLGDDEGGIFGSSGVGEQDNFALNESIIAGTTKLEVQLLSANEKLQKIIDKPFIALNFGDLQGPDLEKFKEGLANMRAGGMSFADEAVLKGKDAISKGVNWAWDATTWGAKKTWGGIAGTAKGAWNIGKAGYHGAKRIAGDWFDDARDVLLKGTTEVKIKAEDIRNKVLKDVNTGKIIEKLKDITGEVRRVDTDEIVLRVEDFKRGLTDDKFKPALEWITKKFGQVKDIALAPFRAVRATYNHILQIIDMPDDIYIKGDSPWEPRMRAHLFRAGKYSDAKTGKPIVIISDIKGAVMQDMGIGKDPVMVITDEEFNEGKLVASDGEPIKGLRDRIYSGIKKAGKFVGELAKKGLGMVKDMGAWIWEKLGLGWDGIKSWFDGTGNIQLGIFTTQTATVTRLEQIWMLLNNRLPGEKATQPEDFGKIGKLRIPDLSGKLQSTEEWFNKKKAQAELKAFVAREKLNNKIALLEAKRQDKAAKLRQKYEDKGEKVPFWVRMFGANKQQFKDEVKNAGKAAVDGVKKAKDGLDKPLSFEQYMDVVDATIEKTGIKVDREDEGHLEICRKEYIKYRAEFDKLSKTKKIASNAWAFGGMAKNIATKWGKGQVADIKETINDAIEDNARPMAFAEWLDKEWNMDMTEFNTLPMNAPGSGQSKNSLRDAWAKYSHDFTIRMAKAKETKDKMMGKAGNLKDATKGLLSGNKDFIGPIQPMSVKLGNFLNDKSANLRETLSKAKPKTFNEWLADTPVGLAGYSKMGNTDKAELEKQYETYCIKFEKDREEQLGALNAKTTKTLANLYNYFTKHKDLTIDQYMDDIGVTASEYNRAKAAGEEKATALKADYDAYMKGDVKAIARYNRLSAMETAKKTVAKAKSLKDKAIAAKIDIKNAWGNRASFKDKAKSIFSGTKGKLGSFFESDEDRYNKWQEEHSVFNADRGQVRQITFDNYIDGLGLSEQEFDLLPDDEKRVIIANFEKHNRGGVTATGEPIKGRAFGRTRDNLSNMKNKLKGMFKRKDSSADAESDFMGPQQPTVKRGLFGTMKDKATGLFKNKSFSDADGDGDRDGSAADQKQQREAAEERGWLKKMAGSFGAGFKATGGEKGGGGILDMMKNFLNPGKLLAWGGTFMTTIGGIFLGLTKGLGAVLTVGKAIAKLPLGNIIKAAGSVVGGVARAASAVLGGGLGMAVRGAQMGLAILTNPVVLAVGATAFAGYKAYQAIKRSQQNNDVIFRFRMAQYGFKHDDDEVVGKILQTEKTLQGVVRVGSDGIAELGQGIKTEQLLAIWGIDQEKQEEVTRWITWFVCRFKPIYLSHVTMNMALLKTPDLTKADTLNADDSLKYIKAVHFAGDGKRPYDIMASPEAGGDTVDFAGSAWISRSVDNEYDAAVAWCEDHKEEMDLENQAQTDKKAAQKLKELRENSWQAKTEAAWDTTKKVINPLNVAEHSKVIANFLTEAPEQDSWYNPLKGLKMMARGAAEYVAQKTIDRQDDAYSHTAATITDKVADRQKMVYQAFIKAGFAPEQAKAMTAEVGRENDYTDTMFKTHIDPAKDKKGNNIINLGFFSWNKGRYAKLLAKLEAAGLIHYENKTIRRGKGKDAPVETVSLPMMEKSQRSLDTMAKFAHEEIFGGGYPSVANYLKSNPRAMAESLAKTIGKSYIGWAYEQTDVAGPTPGSRVPFDWRGADTKRRRYLLALEKTLGTVGDTKSEALAGAKETNASGLLAEGEAAEKAASPDAKVASTGAPAPKDAAKAALDKSKTTQAAATALSTIAATPAKSTADEETTASTVRPTVANTSQTAQTGLAAATSGVPITRTSDEDTGLAPSETPNVPQTDIIPVSSTPANIPRAVDDMDNIPVDIMAEKQKAQQEAAIAAAEKRRQDALDSTSTGMDAAVALMKEQLRVMTSMDSNLTKIEKHMANMAKGMGSSGSSPSAPSPQSSKPNLQLVQNQPQQSGKAPISVSRAS